MADKLSALLLFFDKVPLHVTRPVRWDSDHVVLFDDPTKEVAMEIAHIPGAWEKVIIGLDFFDASINRAWAPGPRARARHGKVAAHALLQPGERLKELQDTYQFTEKMMLAEQAKSMPFGAVWDEYCRRAGCPLDGELYPAVAAYEARSCPSACSSTKVSPRGVSSRSNDMAFFDQAQEMLSQGIDTARGAVSGVAMEQLGFVRGFVRLCNDGWEQGWHERNGGNLSYRLRPEDVDTARKFFDKGSRVLTPLGVEAPTMGGVYRHWHRQLHAQCGVRSPRNIGIVELSAAGDAYRIVWGLDDGAVPRPSSRPTS